MVLLKNCRNNCFKMTINESKIIIFMEIIYTKTSEINTKYFEEANVV